MWQITVHTPQVLSQIGYKGKKKDRDDNQYVKRLNRPINPVKRVDLV